VLRVTVELFPGGLQSQRRTLATMDIGNISGLADRSDYTVHIAEADNSVTGQRGWSSSGTIFGHDRRQSVWALVEKAAAFGCREGEKQ
jgi:hypothetical protein